MATPVCSARWISVGMSQRCASRLSTTSVAVLQSPVARRLGWSTPPVGSRWNVSTKVHRRRLEWMSRTYPRAATEEPNSLPRRGRRGGWMREPSRGVAKLDGTNSAQQDWWAQNAEEVDREFLARLREAEAGGHGQVNMQDVFDEHLSALDALKVQMPAADGFRKPHIKRLSETSKPNLIHDATSTGPPLSAVPDPQLPDYVEDSLRTRDVRRRGRFLGAPARRPLPEDERAQEAIVSDEAAACTSDTGDLQSQFFPNRQHKDASGKGISQDGVGVDDALVNTSLGRRSRLRVVRRVHVVSANSHDVSQSSSQSSSSSSSSTTRLRSSQRSRLRASREDSHFDEQGERAAPEPMEPVRTTSLGDVWGDFGASWAVFNHCVVPSAFPEPESGKSIGDTLYSYEHTRRAASLFDLSYKARFRVGGADREFVADQFLTCSLGSMRSGDVQYACILDSKGLILDEAFVYLFDDWIEILSSGCHARQVAEYLGQYVVYVRRSGADVSFEVMQSSAVVALQGPCAREALRQAIGRVSTGSRFPVSLSSEASGAERLHLHPDLLRSMPFMSFLTLRGEADVSEVAVVLCVGSTGEDGFEIVAPEGNLLRKLVKALLDDDGVVRPAGIHSYDILRMEAGLPRIGADIPPGNASPVRASLSWVLDQSKMRSHILFGWRKHFHQLAKGPPFRRVGLIVDGPVHGGCRILSNPHRQPIGSITSSAWSPALSARIAMAEIKPEYARANLSVLVTVPYNLPTHKMLRKAIKVWTRMGPLRSGYRRIVAGCVMGLPFVPHRYPEPERQRKANARLRPFGADGPPLPEEPRNPSAVANWWKRTDVSVDAARENPGKIVHPSATGLVTSDMDVI
eukprot:TRINITY_DN10686_c0_g1_i1.p1 TRINITY_DN10686_c0_g1~~TRINITY_DN10686_c0_g1_i1.p1  ORF type:complete len:858 (+),score=114.46 TRINITY_DN10686_c0_g1_i1:85-2658(+)